MDVFLPKGCIRLYGTPDEEYDLDTIKVVPFRQSPPAITLFFASNTRTGKMEGIGLGLSTDSTQEDVGSLVDLLEGWFSTGEVV